MTITAVPATGLQLRTLVKKDGTLELSLASVPTPEPKPEEVIVRCFAVHRRCCQHPGEVIAKGRTVEEARRRMGDVLGDERCLALQKIPRRIGEEPEVVESWV